MDITTPLQTTSKTKKAGLIHWPQELNLELQKEYMQKLKAFLTNELKKGKIIYPKGQEIFQALEVTAFDQVKVVIIGQDPYHGPNQAHGMCFSVKPGVAIPPSLVNIYKEIENDLGHKPPSHGYLLSWAKQGVLLLNNVLTVEKAKAASHHGVGWETFTDKVIQVLNQRSEPMAFLLWGSPAQKKASIVDDKKHLVLRSVHPSPLSAYRGFFGQKHFSRINAWLEKQGKSPIDWSIPELSK